MKRDHMRGRAPADLKSTYGVVLRRTCAIICSKRACGAESKRATVASLNFSIEKCLTEFGTAIGASIGMGWGACGTSDPADAGAIGLAGVAESADTESAAESPRGAESAARDVTLVCLWENKEHTRYNAQCCSGCARKLLLHI